MTALLIDAVDAVETTELPVLEFVAPMPGFPEQRRFVLVRVGEEGVLFALTSVDRPGLRFLVAPPAPFFPDYAPEVDEEALAALGTTDPDDLLVLLVINTGDAPNEASANLMAPIVLSQENRRAVQLVLNRSGLPVRAPLLAG
jgi:flagellar assembly factor FliW